MRSHVARGGLYAVWVTGMGQVVGIGLQRLVVFPGLFRLMGAALFGPFVLAYSIVSVLSYAPIASLNLAYYRQQQRLNSTEFASLTGAAFLLGITVASGLALAFVVLTPFWGWLFTNPGVGTFVPGMAVVLGAMGIMWTLDSQLMLRGEFAHRAFLQAMFGILAVAAVGLAWIDAVWGVSAGLVMASLGVSVLAFRRLWQTGAIVVERGSVLATWRALVPGAGAYLLNTLGQMSVQYADRLVLGMYASGEVVSSYFAASMVAVLCCMPFSLVSSVLVPLMLSGRISIVDRAGALRYFGAIGLGALVTVLLGVIVGPEVLGILYGGEVAHVNQVVFPILLAGQAVYLLQQFSRPLLPLYFPFALQILIDVVSASGLIGLLLWAAPTAGVIGVAAVAAAGAAAFGFVYAGASVALAGRAAEAAVRTREPVSGRTTHERNPAALGGSQSDGGAPRPAGSGMHVLLIHQHFATLTDGGGTRHFELGRALVEAGHRVTVVAGSVSYLTGELVPSVHGASTVARPLPGMEIRRGRAYRAIHRSFVARAGSFASFMASSFWAGLTVPRVDVVFGTSPPLLQGLSGLAVARLKRVPFVFEVRDLWPDFAVAAGVLRHRLLIAGLRRVERLLYDHADHLIVNSPGFIAHLRTRGVPEAKLDVIPNGVDVAMFHPARQGSAIRAGHRLDGKFVCVYAGAHGAANDLETLLRAAERLRGYPDIAFLLVGDGKERGRLIRLAQERELGNVVFVASQPKNRMPDILAAADVCVAILQWTPMFATTYPNKVFDYMAAGRPTVLAIDGVIRSVIEAAEGGLFVPGADPDALAAAVLTYYRDPELRARHGANARRYVAAHFDRTLQADRLKTVLESLVQTSSPLRLKRSRV